MNTTTETDADLTLPEIAYPKPTRTFSRPVEFTLTDGELRVYGDKLAAEKLKRDYLVAAAKEEARKRKSAIGDVSAEIDRLAAAVNTRKEFRDVLCFTRAEGPHKVTRTLDGEVLVDTAALEQPDLPGLDDDFGSFNHQKDADEDDDMAPDADVLEFVASSAAGGPLVAHMPDDEESEAPFGGEEPVSPASNGKAKGKGGKAKRK